MALKSYYESSLQYITCATKATRNRMLALKGTVGNPAGTGSGKISGEVGPGQVEHVPVVLNGMKPILGGPDTKLTLSVG
jgi:hypothetical protein